MSSSPVSLQVIEVKAKKRTGDHSLVAAMRNTLESHYPEKSLALGGTFIIQKGKAKIHIMVHFGHDTRHMICCSCQWFTILTIQYNIIVTILRFLYLT